jgi:hypothetical protein
MLSWFVSVMSCAWTYKNIDEVIHVHCQLLPSEVIPLPEVYHTIIL